MNKFFENFEKKSVRTATIVEQEIRLLYVNATKDYNFNEAIVAEVMSDLASSHSWTEFARKQQINTLRIEPETDSAKIRALVNEYYELKRLEDN